MSDDSDDPVMQLLATQRAVLAAVENLAGQVEAMQGTLAQLVASSVANAAPATNRGAARGRTIGDRFRTATADEAAADPELAAAQAQLTAMDVVIRTTLAGNPDAIERVRAEGREQIAKLLDQGKKIRPASKGVIQESRERDR